MADTVREQITSFFITQLQTLLVVNGFETNVGNNVFEWRSTDLQENELPGIIFRDTLESSEIRGNAQSNTIGIELELKTTGSTAITQMRKIIADISKLIASNTTLSGLIQNVTIPQNESISTDQKDKTIFSGVLSLSFQYITPKFDLFNLLG